MNLRLVSLPGMLVLSLHVAANTPIDSAALYQKALQQFKDSIAGAMKYSTGKIKPEGDKVILNIPAGFKYLNKEQSKYVLVKLWGNSESATKDMIGMIFPEEMNPFTDSAYAFIIANSEIGYVKDEDADDIDYDEMMENLQSEEKIENERRANAGYQEVHLVGWAQKPYYDKQKKILCWAKETQLGDGEGENTLSYEIRILGRKGIVSLSTVAKMNKLSLVNKDIGRMLDAVSFTQGNSYSDFNPGTDQVSAWTLETLVAGKSVRKEGVFTQLLKFVTPFWKVIVLLFIGIGWWVKRSWGKKKAQFSFPQGRL